MIPAEQAKQIVRDILEIIADDLEAAGHLQKDRCLFMVDGLRYWGMQSWEGEKAPPQILKCAMMSVAAGLSSYQNQIDSLYQKGCISKAMNLADQMLKERCGIDSKTAKPG